MPRFNLVHCLHHPTKPHGLTGYTEVIEAIVWGLEQLGHEVQRSVNQPDPTCFNIFFGAQILSTEILESLPESSIIYNFEQMRNVPTEHIIPQMQLIAKRFQVWDYSTGNKEAWVRLGGGNIKIVPIGYAPILSRMRKAEHQDIDILIYGGSDEKRLQAFHTLAEAGLTVMYVCGLYGQSRDNLIARAKLVLNINRYSKSRVFEIVRVSYLLANRKAVISTFSPDTVIEDDIKSCVRLTDFDRLISDCRFLTENDQARSLLEDIGFNTFAQRDIRAIVNTALAGI